MKDIQNIPKVRDFPNTFPEELPGLPPQRQFEFRIDLVTRATPVAKSPYRVAPTKILELPRQLNELLRRGFFRPSFSLGGAPDLSVHKKESSKR